MHSWPRAVWPSLSLGKKELVSCKDQSQLCSKPQTCESFKNSFPTGRKFACKIKLGNC